MDPTTIEMGFGNKCIISDHEFKKAWLVSFWWSKFNFLFFFNGGLNFLLDHELKSH
jgi:hypothetical protein